MIYKIKIKDKRNGEEDFIIMGDSYKPFKEHFGDAISMWTEKWHYANEDKYAECFGRTIAFEILEVWYSKNKFVSFGGLKMCVEKKYNQKVKEHNENGKSMGCKFLEDIDWKLESQEFIKLLLKEKRVISEERLKELTSSSLINKNQHLEVKIEVHENWYTQEGKIKKKDISNREKFLIDSIFMALGIDDRQIFSLKISKIQDTEEKAVIEINGRT